MLTVSVFLCVSAFNGSLGHSSKRRKNEREWSVKCVALRFSSGRQQHTLLLRCALASSVCSGADADRGRRWREVLTDWVTAVSAARQHTVCLLTCRLTCAMAAFAGGHLLMLLTRVRCHCCSCWCHLPPTWPSDTRTWTFFRGTTSQKIDSLTAWQRQSKCAASSQWAVQLEANLFRPQNYLHSLPDNFHVLLLVVICLCVSQLTAPTGA